jgi:glutathione S-transferase
MGYDSTLCAHRIGVEMLLIGVNRSPLTRRVAITLNVYGMPFEQRTLSGFYDRAEVRVSNPLGRIPEPGDFWLKRCRMPA